MHAEVFGCLISCKALANNSNIPESKLVYQTLGLGDSFHVVAYPSKKSGRLVPGFFQSKIYESFKITVKKNCPVFLYSNFYCIYNFSNYFKNNNRGYSFQFKKMAF